LIYLCKKNDVGLEGEGIPYKKDGGAHTKFEEESPRGTDILFFWVWLEILFPPNPKWYCESSSFGPFEAEYPKSYQNLFFNP